MRSRFCEHGRERSRPPGRPGITAATALALVLTWAATAPSAAGGQQPARTGLTVYMQDQALVRASLERHVPAGRSTVRVDGLPANVDAASLLVADPAVTLLGVHGRRTYRGPGDESAVSLALDVRADRARDTLRLAYLTGGTGWSASYSVLVGGDDRTAGIHGYATITNESGTTFADARVQLLAGTVDTDGADRGPGLRHALAAAEAADRSSGLAREAFAGYHLYEIDDPLTLQSGASRRVRLTGADSVSVERQYVLEGDVSHDQHVDEPRRREASIRYRVERPGGTSFAERPLPGGTVRVFRPDDEGRLQLLGADRIPNTPAGEELTVSVGRAFDVFGVRRQTAYERAGPDRHESAWSVALTNRTDAPVTVRVIDRIPGDWEILSSSHEHERLSASRVRFGVRVPADGETTLEYRVRVEE